MSRKISFLKTTVRSKILRIFPRERLVTSHLDFQKMTLFHEAMEDLEQHLTEAEREKGAWQGVGDILIKELPAEIEATKV